MNEPTTRQQQAPAVQKKTTAERVEGLANWIAGDKEIKPNLTYGRKYEGNAEEVAAAKASDVEHFKLGVMALIRRQPDLLECDPFSFCVALRQCARLQLAPDPQEGHVWLLPFFDTKKGIRAVQFILGYKGMMELAHRVPIVEHVQARIVLNGDEFGYAYGLHPRLEHVPSTAPTKGREITHAYAIIRLRDSAPIFAVVSRDEIDAIRNRSKAKGNSPWVTDFAAMAAKTAIRQVFKWIPLRPAEARIMHMLERAEAEIEDREALIEARHVNRANFGMAISQRVQGQIAAPAAMPSPLEDLAQQPEPQPEAQEPQQVEAQPVDSEEPPMELPPEGLFGDNAPAPEPDPVRR